MLDAFIDSLLVHKDREQRDFGKLMVDYRRSREPLGTGIHNVIQFQPKYIYPTADMGLVEFLDGIKLDLVPKANDFLKFIRTQR